MTTKATSGYIEKRAIEYNQKITEGKKQDSDQKPSTPISTPETGWESTSEEHEPFKKPDSETLNANWEHTDNESDEEAPFPNQLDDSFVEALRAEKSTSLLREDASLSHNMRSLCKSASIGGRIGTHLSREHQHWRIGEDLQQMCLHDKNLDRTIRDALQKLDSTLGDADVVVRIEIDNEEPFDPRPLIHITMPVENANDWHDKKIAVQDIVDEVKSGDRMVYTTVDRRK